jgi:hypothetical protein
MRQLSCLKIGETTKMRFLTGTIQVSLMAMSAALYTTFFFLSYAVTLPNFTLLYLPIILLGVFPLWFGLSGLAGCMIGAYIGGVFVEGLPLHFAFAESVTALIIFSLNWLLIPRRAAEAKTPRSLFYLAIVYAFTLLVGTSYILWQLAYFGIFPYNVAQAVLLPTFALNLPIVVITCPVLIRAISPKLKLGESMQEVSARGKKPSEKFMPTVVASKH